MPKRDRDRLSPVRTDEDVRRILELVVEVREAWEDVVDAGSWTPRVESNGRGKGFSDLNPTLTTVMMPTQIQLRQGARYAAGQIHQARKHLEDAAAAIHLALIRTDPEVMVEFLERRDARREIESVAEGLGNVGGVE